MAEMDSRDLKVIEVNLDNKGDLVRLVLLDNLG